MILWCITIALAVHRGNVIEQQDITISEKNNKIKGYEDAIQKYISAQERSGETIQKVRTIVRTVKSDCDCYNTLVDERVRDTIKNRRKNHK